MFSVRAENILLNYFVVLFTVGFLLFYSFSHILLGIFLGIIFCGLLLYFDRYFFFKMAFLITILIAIFVILFSSSSKILVLFLLIISLSQLCLLLAYIILSFFLLKFFEFLDIYIIFSVCFFSLIFTLFFGLRKMTKEFYSKLFSTEGRFCSFRHNLGNLCSVIFLKNKDHSLDSVLEEMKLNFYLNESVSEKSQLSVAGLLRMTIYFLNYEYNLSVKKNFHILGDNLSWVCFFCHLLDNYCKRGSTIVLKEDGIFIVLNDVNRKELKKFLANELVMNKSEIRGNVLKLVYGM